MNERESTEGIPFGRYRIRKRLGTGGMGEVFLADQMGPIGPVRPVALKRMRPPLARDPDLARRFVQEMSIAARLNHPHIAVTHDFGEVDGVYFMAMEYIDGAPLDRVLEEGALPVPAALLVAQRVAAALAHAHERAPPVVHQDVSPQNIMVGTRGEVKLLDFGIAAAEAVTQASLRAKAPYAAPEQLMGQPPERRFDVWALGVVLYEMLTGRRPFAGPGAKAVLDQIKARSLPPVEVLNPAAAAISPLIRRALDPRPHRRWASAREFSDACTVLLARRESAAEQSLASRVPDERSVADDPNATGTAVPASGASPQLPQKRRDPSILLLILAVMLGSGAWLTLTRGTWFSADLAPMPPASADGLAHRSNTEADVDPARTQSASQQRAPTLGTATTAKRPTAKKAIKPRAASVGTRTAPRSRSWPSDPAAKQEKTQAGRAPGSAAAPPRRALGMLSVRSTPWARVEFDGVALGEGIIAERPVPVGRHRVRLIPGEGTYTPLTVGIRIEAGRVTRIFADFVTEQVRVRPPE